MKEHWEMMFESEIGHLGHPFHRNADDEAERYADGNVQGHDSSEQEGLRLVNEHRFTFGADAFKILYWNVNNVHGT